MSDEVGISKEKAKWFGQLQNKEIEIKDPVMLLSKNIRVGTEVLTGPYEREMVQEWLVRAVRENSGYAMEWEIKEIGEK